MPQQHQNRQQEAYSAAHIPLFFVYTHHKQILLIGEVDILIPYTGFLSILQYTNITGFWLAFIFIIVDFLYSFGGKFWRVVHFRQNGNCVLLHFIQMPLLFFIVLCAVILHFKINNRNK